jgi:hypothetical protein
MPAPTVALASLTAVAVGQPVTFSFDFADDGALAHVLWDLGEGLPVTGARATHTYTALGQYRVSLVVWDDDGRAAYDEFVLQVVPEPSSIALAAIGIIAIGVACWRQQRGSL